MKNHSFFTPRAVRTAPYDVPKPSPCLLSMAPSSDKMPDSQENP